MQQELVLAIATVGVASSGFRQALRVRHDGRLPSGVFCSWCLGVPTVIALLPPPANNGWDEPMPVSAPASDRHLSPTREGACHGPAWLGFKPSIAHSKRAGQRPFRGPLSNSRNMRGTSNRPSTLVRPRARHQRSARSGWPSRPARESGRRGPPARLDRCRLCSPLRATRCGYCARLAARTISSGP